LPFASRKTRQDGRTDGRDVTARIRIFIRHQVGGGGGGALKMDEAVKLTAVSAAEAAAAVVWLPSQMRGHNVDEHRKWHVWAV